MKTLSSLLRGREIAYRLFMKNGTKMLNSDQKKIALIGLVLVHMWVTILVALFFGGSFQFRKKVTVTYRWTDRQT